LSSVSRQPENRLTHALMTALNEDRRLLKEFIAWVTGKVPPDVRRIQVTEQQLPGEEERTEEASPGRRGLPDGWIQSADGWALLIESKIESPLTSDQLSRHWKTARGRGLSNISLLAIVTDKSARSRPDWILVREWREVYEWLGQRPWSTWARRTADYMEILEGKLADEGYLKEGTLTKFAGIPFDADRPYTYLEAKRVMRLLTEELRTRKALIQKLGMDPKGKGRPAITGSSTGRVWDFIPLTRCRKEKVFTRCPHLTLSIQTDRLVAVVTVPHGLKPEYRRNLLGDGPRHFRGVIQKVYRNMGAICKEDGASPRIELLQRHYPTQRISVTDAVLEFDLRTAFPAPAPRTTRKRPAPKIQPHWLDTTYDVLNNRSSNLQMIVGASFDYDRCEGLQTPKAVSLVAETWLACEPLLSAIFRPPRRRGGMGKIL